MIALRILSTDTETDTVKHAQLGVFMHHAWRFSDLLKLAGLLRTGGGGKGLGRVSAAWVSMIIRYRS